MELERDEGFNLVRLTSKNVDTVIRDCLYDDADIVDGALPEEAITVEAIMLNVGFNPVKIAEHTNAIKDMLSYLPVQFFKDDGGGWTFLNMPTRNDGSQWGEQRDADALLALGIAIGKAEIQMPRDMWAMFPGGVPYIAVERD